MEFIKQLFTQSNNETGCVARVGAFIGLLTICSCAVMTVYQGQPFQAHEIGIGLGVMLGALGYSADKLDRG